MIAAITIMMMDVTMVMGVMRFFDVPEFFDAA